MLECSAFGSSACCLESLCDESQSFLAVTWLAGGGSIQKVAADLGYERVPSFVTMYKKALVTSPSRYMAERHSGRL